MVRKKTKMCQWKYSHDNKIKNKPPFVKCAVCGRIKREDLPDTQPCSGSNVSYQSMIKKIMGQDMDERDIKDLEKIQKDKDEEE